VSDPIILFDSNDMLFHMKGMQFKDSGDYMNASDTVRITLYDKDGTQLTGQTWPFSLTYTAASSGDFVGVLNAEIVANDCDTGRAKVEAIGAGPSELGQWDLVWRMQRRHE